MLSVKARNGGIFMRRRTPAERLKKEKILTVIYAALACVGAIFLASVTFSGIATVIDLSDGAFTAMSSAALCAGCFAASFTVAKRKRKNGIKTGLLCGVLIFLLTFTAGLFFVKSFSAGGFFTKLLIILTCSAIGGIVGVNSPHKG